MFVTFILLHLLYPSTQALPISPLDQRATSSCDNIENCRTTWDIIWSCLVTIFSCTWVAIHPNIPGPNEGSIKIGLRRMRIMAMALIAPELVIAWAVRQWFVSRRLAQEHREHGWTQTHGFFALMGGFMLCRDGKAPRALLPEDVDELVEKGEICFPSITEKEIQDRSKGDMLSKGFVILQTTWFALQCVARRVQHLPTTELEIATLAFTALTVTTYGLWWNKPLNVNCAYQVHRNPRYSAGTEGEGEQADRESESEAWDVSALDPVTNSVVITGSVAYRMWGTIKRAIETAKRAVPRLVYRATFRPFMNMGLSMSSGIFTDLNLQRVPSFHAGRLTDTEKGLLFVISPVLATIFGSIHCIAWFFDFPSHLEQMLWRICSLVIICAPMYLALSGKVFLIFSNSIGQLYILLCIRGPFLLYICCRVTLLVLAFRSMRSLPPGAYQTVSWINFIPHV